MSQGAATLNDVAYWVDSRAEAQEAGFPKLWDIARTGKVETTAVLQMLSSSVGQTSAAGSSDGWCPRGSTTNTLYALPPMPKMRRFNSIEEDESKRMRAAAEAIRMTLAWGHDEGPAAGLRGKHRQEVLNDTSYWMQKVASFEVKTIRDATYEYKKWSQWLEANEGTGPSTRALANRIQCYIHQRSRFPFMRRSVYHRLRWCATHLQAPLPMHLVAKPVMPLAGAVIKQPPAITPSGVERLELLAAAAARSGSWRALPLLAMLAQILGCLRRQHIERSKPLYIQGGIVVMWASRDKVARDGGRRPFWWALPAKWGDRFPHWGNHHLTMGSSKSE